MESWNSHTSYTKFKLLEENYDAIVQEIPPFDINNVTLERKFYEWGDNEAGELFKQRLSINKEWIYSWDVNRKMFNFPLIHNDNAIGLAETVVHLRLNYLNKLKTFALRDCLYSFLIHA